MSDAVKNDSGREMVQPLFALAQTVSQSRLVSQAKVDDVIVAPYPSGTPAHGHWLGLILLSSASCRITFKIFFSEPAARHLARAAYERRVEDITLNQAHDFIRELCNLIAGGVAHVINDQNHEMGISLPVIARGFDDYFSEEIVSEFVVAAERFWTLSSSNLELVCGCDVQVFDPAAFRSLAFSLPNANDGEVEVL